MKRITSFLFVFFLASIDTHAQIDFKTLHKSFAKINDTLYASQYEVSNQQYRAFVDSLKQSKRSEQLAIATVDSSNWVQDSTYDKPYADYYHWYIAYDDYPVVNVSRDAAIMFCDWLTAQYNADPKRKIKRVEFRLPTAAEWTEAAKGGNLNAVYGFGEKSSSNKFYGLPANYKHNYPDSITASERYDNADIFVPVFLWEPNDYGLHNMSGNVAEMVADKPVVKGGSWMQTEENLRVDAEDNYDGTPKAYVGFRMFMVILEK